MAYPDQQIDQIYRSTGGRCHLCHRKLSRKNYGQSGERAAWHVDHSVPRSKGGSDRLNNLKPACIDCNLDKGNKTTRTARRRNGKTGAPLSLEKYKEAKVDNAIVGAIGGGLVGLAIAGPVGGVAGLIVGGHFGASKNPNQ